MTFREITGQEQALGALKKALERDMLSHSLLFSGPEGTGKRLAALALSMELNCKNPSRGEACGECPDCRLIRKSAHPDTIVISPEGRAMEIKIESVRSLRRNMHVKPVRGGHKIFIIDGAERLNQESSNALLKVLEEPPEKSMLILLTPEPYTLLPTIVSRCREVKFRRLTLEDTETILAKNPDIPGDRRRLLSRLSGGSPGRALSLFKNGLERREEIFGWLFPADGPPPGVLEILSSGEKKAGLNAGDAALKRENLLSFLDFLLSWYRDVLVSSAGGGSLVNEDYSANIAGRARRLRPSQAAGALKTLLSAREQTKLFANPKLVFENAMFDIIKTERGDFL